jgi:bacteriorhodopsin
MTSSETRLVLLTARLSLAAQFLFFLISLIGFFDISNNSIWNQQYLVSLLILEEVSQAIEFSYYFIVSLILRYPLPTYSRYLDWFFSTPIMLVSAIGFMYYEELRIATSSDSETVLTLTTLWNDKFRSSIISVVLLNAVMLIIGFMVEVQRIPPIYLITATIAFIGYYIIILIDVGTVSSATILLWFYMFMVWGCYGIAATQPFGRKNISYNLLDILSKNVYGVFLALYISTANNIIEK